MQSVSKLKNLLCMGYIFSEFIGDKITINIIRISFYDCSYHGFLKMFSWLEIN